MGCVVPMASVAVSLSTLDSMSTTVDEMLMSRIPYIDYSSSTSIPFLTKQTTWVGVGTFVRPLVQTGCFFISKTENDTVGHVMAGFQHVGKFGRRLMYVFGPDNDGANSVRSISKDPVHVYTFTFRLNCVVVYCTVPLIGLRWTWVCQLNLKNSFATCGMDILDSTYDSQYPTGPDVYSSPAYILI
jgi:hypothetical protein